ncbi:3-isopropylmalate dehydratase [Labrenzia sp. OB1]|uniref:LeuD/DmdB family oxidoreductase small subunit n=1 Tax=Labrenzia sp. OB1 TaxID=1561204 RepID=UPI0007B180A1|nr:3-isopropylmalate dehydratase [Labrenzia sp. OB1]KZM50528.1 3-isopropylmalate dehydratase [Labrenzia sp. OB1]
MSDVALKYGDDISTDLIIAGKYTKTLNLQDLVDHAMEDIDPDFLSRVGDGAVLVAGKYFGCGSSREQAPVALKAAGIKVVLASSFARIFFRNAINIGLPIMECDTSSISDGDRIDFDIGTGTVTNVTTGAVIQAKPLPDNMVKILSAGGVVEYLKEQGSF